MRAETENQKRIRELQAEAHRLEREAEDEKRRATVARLDADFPGWKERLAEAVVEAITRGDNSAHVEIARPKWPPSAERVHNVSAWASAHLSVAHLQHEIDHEAVARYGETTSSD